VNNMLVNAVCKECGLTKKAVEYYIEQGLVAPSVQENGYRDFSEADIARLKKIYVLRGLGLSAAEIRNVLAHQNVSLNDISHQKVLEISVMQEKQKLVQELARTQDWDTVQEKLVQLQKKQSVLERMRVAFPGYYGNYICQHFAPFLGEPVRTAQQQEAFDTIIAFLDGIQFEVPGDLRAYYEEITLEYEDSMLERVAAGMRSAICNIEQYMDENREAIEACMAYKQTEEYKTSKAYRLEETLSGIRNGGAGAVNEHKIFKTFVRPVVMLIIGLNCIFKDLQMAVVAGIGIYAVIVWIERVFRSS